MRDFTRGTGLLAEQLYERGFHASRSPIFPHVRQHANTVTGAPRIEARQRWPISLQSARRQSGGIAFCLAATVKTINRFLLQR